MTMAPMEDSVVNNVVNGCCHVNLKEKNLGLVLKGPDDRKLALVSFASVFGPNLGDISREWKLLKAQRAFLPNGYRANSRSLWLLIDSRN